MLEAVLPELGGIGSRLGVGARVHPARLDPPGAGRGHRRHPRGGAVLRMLVSSTRERARAAQRTAPVRRRGVLPGVAGASAVAPHSWVRSNFIVGFPGETQEDFAVLKDFLQVADLDAIGIFGYSDEDGTEAADLPDHTDEDTIAERARTRRPRRRAAWNSARRRGWAKSRAC